MRRTGLPCCLLLCISCLAATSLAADPAVLRYVESNPQTGSSAAVVVPDVPLVFTRQFLPASVAGHEPQSGEAAAQLASLWRQLSEALPASNSDLGHVVKLNFYLAREDLTEIVSKDLAARFKSEQRPAVSFVVTPLPHAGALIALDAVAAASAKADTTRLAANAAVMPPGCRLYVSGQAEKGSTLAEATRKTLQSLSATLRHCGRSDRDILQLKCFLNPMKSVSQAQQEIERHFLPGQLPPVTYVEWRSAAPSIEIELVAWGGPALAANDVLEFITPPGMTNSPLFSRVARIHRGGSIFLGDLYGPATASAAEQVKLPFEKLNRLLAQTGSDFKHLVKATYYLTDDEVSKAHNAIRPTFYDPARPPAASKALVAGTGRAGVRYAMDLLAVPTR